MKAGNIYGVLCLAAALMLPPGHASAQTNTGANINEAKKAIVQSNEQYFQAFVKKDMSIFINLYAGDCWIMPPNAPALCGPAAPRDFFTTAYNTFGVRNGKFITIDIYGIAEDMVAEIGFFKLYDANNIEFDDGKFLVLWKKTAKGWLR
jgi:ketosteroid isomerase-like protein